MIVNVCHRPSWDDESGSLVPREPKGGGSTLTLAGLNAASCAESGRLYRQRASAYSLDKAMKMDARIRSLDQAAAILRE